MATGASGPIPIYVSSSLDTALGVAVSSEDTILSLKRKLEQEHPAAFPGIGDIIVKSLQIKSRQHFFHLSDSIPVRAVVDRLKGCGFLCMDAAMAPQHRARMPDREPCQPTALLQNQDTEEACEIETNSIVDGVVEDQGKTNQGLQQNVTTMEGPMQRGEPSEIDKPVKKKKRNMSLQEIAEPALCSDENTRKKRRKKQIEGPSSDREYLVQPVRANESLKGGDNVPENHISSEIETASEVPKGDSLMTGNAGDAPSSFQCGNVPTGTSQLEKGKLVPENDVISDKETEPNDELTAEQTTSPDGRSKETMENSPKKEDLSDKTACTSNVNPEVDSLGKRIHKETKATSLDTSAQENIAQPSESCKGKESNTSFEIETCKRTGDVLTNGTDEASFIVPISKDQNGSSLNQGSDAIMAESVKISSLAGAKKISKWIRKTKGSSSESPSEVPLAEERKYEQGEVQKSIVIPEKETASQNTMRDSSVAEEPDEISSFTLNGRDPKEGLLDELKVSSPTQVKEKASVPLNASKEPVSEVGKKEKREKLTAPVVLEAGSKAHASDKKISHEKSKEKEGTISLNDVPKADCITGEDSTGNASVPLNEFEEPVSDGKFREKINEVTTFEVLEAESTYASEKKARKGKSIEKEGSISLKDDVPKGDCIIGEDNTEKASLPPSEFEEPVSKAKKRKKRKKLTTPEILEAESKAYASEKKVHKGKSKKKEGRIFSPSDNVPKGDGITGEHSTEKASVPPDEFEEQVSKGNKREKREKVTRPEVLEGESKAYAREKKAPIGKPREKEGRIISLSVNVPKGDGITGEDSTEDEDELERFRVEFRNVTVKNNEEKMNALGVEEKVKQCRLSGGHNWRCKDEALPGKNFCARHERNGRNKALRKNRR